MIPELQTQIDKTIKMLLPIEVNRWVIYGKCKEDMQYYETEHKYWLNPQEWRDHIIYITNKLEI